MPVPDLDFDLSETERAVRDTVQRFARDVMRPAGASLDKLCADAVIAGDSIFWDVCRQYADLGLNALGTELSPLEQARISWIVSEMTGWGDAGLAIAFGAGAFPANFATLSGHADLMARFPAGEIGCWAITEPDHGSDLIDFDDAILFPGGKRSLPNTVARANGDEYVISGQKSAWVSNGTIARSAALFCALQEADGRSGGGVFLVPLEGQPGVSKGRPLEKIGQRALNQGEIFFDDVRIPAAFKLAGIDEYRDFTDSTLTMANSGMSSCFAGVARAAFELAFDYAKERKQGGAPIIRHQSVKARLFTMYRKVEAARSHSRRVFLHNAVSPTPSLAAAISAKILSTQTAFEVASDALQIFGGAGISREYPIEKIFRDARISMIEDGCNEILGLVGLDRLAAD